LTHDEIIRWFRRFKHDPEFRDSEGSRTVLISPLCEFAGVSRQNVYLILRKEIGLTENYRNRLAYAIECVQAGLRWQRRDKTYRIIGDFPVLPRYESRRKQEHVA
jgi:hypothetical protein